MPPQNWADSAGPATEQTYEGACSQDSEYKQPANQQQMGPVQGSS